jgi:hypothetical protein
MTLDLGIDAMTHDTSPLVPPLYARVREGNGSDTTSVRRSWRRPPWLYDGPLTDRVRLTGCRRCHRPIFEALADGVMPARADLVRLSPLAELRHRLAGGTTLRLIPDDDTPFVPRRLASRWLEHLRAHPGRGLPLHDCQLDHGPPDRDLIPAPNTPDHEEPTW